MRKTALLLMLGFLALPARAAAPPQASPETVKLVRRFLKTPVQELPVGLIDSFLKIDPEILPRSLRAPYKARRLELFTLKQLAEGKKKGTIRMPENDCAVPKEAKSNESGILVAAGYQEIEDTDVQCIMDRTHCTERDMMCEFSLQVVHERVGRKKETRVRYFLHPNDPLSSLLAVCRQGAGGNTNFFGSAPPPVCSR